MSSRPITYEFTGLDDCNVTNAELSVVNSLVLGYMFLGDKIEWIVHTLNLLQLGKSHIMCSMLARAEKNSGGVVNAEHFF